MLTLLSTMVLWAWADGASSFGGGNGSEESTGINEMSNGKCQMANESDSWYTLSGVKLPKRPTKAGLYIRNGQKVSVNPRGR